MWHDGEREPTGPYQTRITVAFEENYCNYSDRPCTKVTNSLAEQFGLNWDKDLGRYEVMPQPHATAAAESYYRSIGATRTERGVYKVVLIHYQGNTSPVKKNLAHWQAQEFAQHVSAHGRIPVILDWDRRSPLPDGQKVFCPDAGHALWGGFGSGDAAVIAALIRGAEAYVGIDSGPDKIVSATDTPGLICWVKHHPIQFHDPAPNTEHLIPTDWRQIPPCTGNAGVQDFFVLNYRWLEYQGEHGLVQKVKDWLDHTFRAKTATGGVVKFVLPAGIGDTMWALHKIRSIASKEPIDIIVSGDPTKVVDNRAVPFLKRFPWIRSVEVMDVPVVMSRENPTNSRGRYVYEADAIKGDFHFLVPNTVLEDGRRLESWLPEHPCDWSVVDTFDWRGTERGRDIGRALAPFAAFYLGPERGNVDEGHNRGFQWEPKDWVALGLSLKERGVSVCVVGAEYDRSYWERYVRPGVTEAGLTWLDMIGRLEIGETLSLLYHSKVFVSYQCGLGIMAHYLGVPTVMWWRADGDSCHPERLVCFDNRMKDAWTNPALADRYLGCVYKRETVADIVGWIDQKGWLK